MSAQEVIIIALAIVAGISALAVWLFKNIMHAALSLTLCMLCLAGIYGMVGAEFLAVTQMIMYAGGITVIIIFGIMLTHPENGKPLAVKRHHIIIGSMIAVLVLACLFWLYQPVAVWEVNHTSMRQIGFALLTDYILPFEWSGLLLLVCLIGAAYTASTFNNSKS